MELYLMGWSGTGIVLLTMRGYKCLPNGLIVFNGNVMYTIYIYVCVFVCLY